MSVIARGKPAPHRRQIAGKIEERSIAALTREEEHVVEGAQLPLTENEQRRAIFRILLPARGTNFDFVVLVGLAVNARSDLNLERAPFAWTWVR